MDTTYSHGTELTPKEAKEFEEAMANMDIVGEGNIEGHMESGMVDKKGNEIIDCQGRLF